MENKLTLEEAKIRFEESQEIFLSKIRQYFKENGFSCISCGYKGGGALSHSRCAKCIIRFERLQVNWIPNERINQRK